MSDQRKKIRLIHKKSRVHDKMSGLDLTKCRVLEYDKMSGLNNILK